MHFLFSVLIGGLYTANFLNQSSRLNNSNNCISPLNGEHRNSLDTCLKLQVTQGLDQTLKRKKTSNKQTNKHEDFRLTFLRMSNLSRSVEKFEKKLTFLRCIWLKLTFRPGRCKLCLFFNNYILFIWELLFIHIYPESTKTYTRYDFKQGYEHNLRKSTRRVPRPRPRLPGESASKTSVMLVGINSKS